MNPSAMFKAVFSSRFDTFVHVCGCLCVYLQVDVHSSLRTDGQTPIVALALAE